jgi:hypothetical protein
MGDNGVSTGFRQSDRYRLSQSARSTRYKGSFAVKFEVIKDHYLYSA